MFTIDRMTSDTISKLNSVVSSFTVSEILDVTRTGLGPDLFLVAVTPYVKKYEPESIEPTEYCDNPDRAVFFAQENEELVGQLILRRSWNSFALIEDILVHPNHRRKGIGTRLLDQSVGWARQLSLKGVSLEMQNTNAPACKLYQRFGFLIGGHDRYLYYGTSNANEVAIFWYFPFSQG